MSNKCWTKWLSWEEDYLKAHYSNTPLVELMEVLKGRSQSAITNRASLYKLKNMTTDAPRNGVLARIVKRQRLLQNNGSV